MNALLLALVLQAPPVETIPLDQPTVYEEPIPEPQPSPFAEPQVTVLAGGTVVLGSSTPTTVEPLARVSVDWRLVGERRPADASVEADFTGLPDAQISFEDARSFRALEMSLGLAYRPMRRLAASGYCEAGFASRLDEGAQKPATTAPLWSSCGVSFRDPGESRARLRIGIGPDERLGWGWQVAAHVKGSLRLASIGRRIGTTLLVRAILGLETPVGQTQRVNIITAGIGLSWDNVTGGAQ